MTTTTTTTTKKTNTTTTIGNLYICLNTKEPGTYNVMNGDYTVGTVDSKLKAYYLIYKEHLGNYAYKGLDYNHFLSLFEVYYKMGQDKDL